LCCKIGSSLFAPAHGVLSLCPLQTVLNKGLVTSGSDPPFSPTPPPPFLTRYLQFKGSMSLELGWDGEEPEEELTLVSNVEIQLVVLLLT
jgi:hypothetical protein